MSEADEIERLRQHWHDLNEAVGATGVTVAVMQERQATQGKQLDRIEAAVTKMAEKRDEDSGRLTVLETRADEAKQQGAKYGAIVGGIIAFAGVAYRFVVGGAE